jgi:hypothetical protein
VVERTENQQTSVDERDRPGEIPGESADKPVSFDFKLRLGTRESTTAQLSGRATGELVQLQPIDWDAFGGLKPDEEERTYQSDSDLQSIIVELANRIAGPDSGPTPVTKSSATATLERAPSKGAPRLPDTGAQVAASVSELPAATAPEAGTSTVAEAVTNLHLEHTTAAAQVEAAQVEAAQVEAAQVDVGLPPIVEQATEPSAELMRVTTNESEERDVAEPGSTNVPVKAAAAPAPALPESVAPAAPIAPEAPALPAAAALVPPAAPAVAEAVVSALPDTTVPAAAGPAAAAPAAPTLISHADAMASSAVAAPPPVIAPLALAKIERRPGAERPSKPVDFHALLGQAGLQSAAVARRKKRHPFRVLFKLIFVLGIVGAGLYFGKVYVLDKRWDGELKPYAEAIAEERQLEWKKTVKVETLSNDEYALKIATSWLAAPGAEADFVDDLADIAGEWRAMGLAEGDPNVADIGATAAASTPVFYDPQAATIYQIDGIPEDLREYALHRALALALLDQHYSWSDRLEDVGPGERLAIRAMVTGDADSVTTAILDPGTSDFDRFAEQTQILSDRLGTDPAGAPIYAVDLTKADAVSLYSGAVDAAGRNDLTQSTVRSDAGVFDSARELNFRAPDLGGSASETRGLMYWYYVLASRLPADDAWMAAVAWDGDQVVVESTPNGTCVSATVATTDDAGQARLVDALQRWASLGPVGAGTIVTPVGLDRIDVHSCDPGAAADTIISDPIASFGRADIELSTSADLGASNEEDRACVTNGLRGFNVVPVIVAGDPNQIEPILASIGEACGLTKR